MRGLLADVNVERHARYLNQLLEHLSLWSVLAEFHLELVTFRDVGLPRDLLDRPLWNRCQDDGWVLFTENRNRDDEDSLEATLADSWHVGNLPVLTLSSKSAFEGRARYREQVATDVAEVLFGVIQGEYLDQPRIYVPR